MSVAKMSKVGSQEERLCETEEKNQERKERWPGAARSSAKPGHQDAQCACAERPISGHCGHDLV